MSEKNNLSSSIKVSGFWSRLVAAWGLVCEYTADYLSGQKYKHCSGLKNKSQKQK